MLPLDTRTELVLPAIVNVLDHLGFACRCFAYTASTLQLRQSFSCASHVPVCVQQCASVCAAMSRRLLATTRGAATSGPSRPTPTPWTWLLLCPVLASGTTSPTWLTPPLVKWVGTAMCRLCSKGGCVGHLHWLWTVECSRVHSVECTAVLGNSHITDLCTRTDEYNMNILAAVLQQFWY